MTAFVFRIALVAAALVAAPRLLHAQAVVRVAAVVSAPQTWEVRRDTLGTARPAPDLIRLPEGLSLRVVSGPASVIRALPSDTSRTVRLVIDYVGS